MWTQNLKISSIIVAHFQQIMSSALRKWTEFATLSELLYKICWESDFFSFSYLSFSSSFILHSKMSWTDDDKIVYFKLQKMINYCSWRENMISLFKRDQAYKIALNQQSKSAESIYLYDLTKLQFKIRLLADTVSFKDSVMMISQSKESTAAAEASASQFSLFWDDIENVYQFYIQEWELHDKWIKLNSKIYNIMWRHIENDCKSILEIRTSFEAWQAVENIY